MIDLIRRAFIVALAVIASTSHAADISRQKLQRMFDQMQGKRVAIAH